MLTTSRMTVWASILASATAIGLLVVAGCTLDNPENRPKQIFGRIGGHGGGGQIIEPRRCLIRVAILDRPFRDPAINDALWRVVDEQAIAPAEHNALEANGLRVGAHHRGAAAGGRDDPQGGAAAHAQGRPGRHADRGRRSQDADQHQPAGRSGQPAGDPGRRCLGEGLQGRQRIPPPDPPPPGRARRRPARYPRDPPRPDAAKLLGRTQRRRHRAPGADHPRRPAGGEGSASWPSTWSSRRTRWPLSAPGRRTCGAWARSCSASRRPRTRIATSDSS